MSKRKLPESTKKIVAYSQKWRCKDCTHLLPPTYQIDHIIPHCISCNDNQQNLSALCPNCHAKKTQRESKRIIRFKKLRSLQNCQLCWFCLRPSETSKGDQINHNCMCNKRLKRITFGESSGLSLISSFDKFCYIDDKPQGSNESLTPTFMPDLRKDLPTNTNKSYLASLLKGESTTLYIELHKDFISVNSKIFPYSVHYTLKEVARAVFIATRTKKFSRKYTNVEIDVSAYQHQMTLLSLTENAPNELLKHIDSNLHAMLTQRIFNLATSTQYTYIVS